MLTAEMMRYPASSNNDDNKSKRSLKNVYLTLIFVTVTILCGIKLFSSILNWNQSNVISKDYNSENESALLLLHKLFERSRILKQKHEKAPPFDVNKLGTIDFIFNRTIFGAIIMSDYGEEVQDIAEIAVVENNSTSLDGSTHKSNTTITASKLSAIRSKNALKMIGQLPFPVTHWPPVFTKACPFTKHQHRTERGLVYAHYQIWLEFVFFDHDVLQSLARKEVKGLYHSTAWSSRSGTFMAAENGSLYKNGLPFFEDDIIVIFEDDADIAVTNIVDAMRNELSNMTTDLLYLGWCEGRLAKPVPLCTQAYAMTRRGARIAIRNFEPCGLALDEQFVIWAKNKLVTWRRAFDSNYVNKFNSDYPQSRDTTKGIFHQKRMGSFNGH
jgi:hypothetical protein